MTTGDHSESARRNGQRRRRPIHHSPAYRTLLCATAFALAATLALASAVDPAPAAAAAAAAAAPASIPAPEAPASTPAAPAVGLAAAPAAAADGSAATSGRASTLSHPRVRSVPLERHQPPLDAKKAQRLPISTLGVIDRSPSALQRMKTSATGHVTLLTGCASTIFSTPVTIGTQTFKALVDTGSATLAVGSAQCTSCGDTPLSPAYTPGPSAEQTGGSVEAVYGSGSWSGRAFKDDVALAGLGSVHMTIGAIDQSTTFFKRSSCQATWQQPNTYQGILGLAYGSIAPSPTDSYWDTVVDDQGVPDIFTIQMCTATGRMWAGGYDSAFFTGSLQWTPITQKKWYVVDMTSVSLGGSAVPGATSAAFGTTIVDSGTTAALFPAAAFSAITNAIRGNAYFAQNFGTDFFTSGQCVIPANGADPATLNANLPQLSLAFNGATLQLDAVSSYLLVMYDGDGTRYYCSGLSSWSESMTILGYAALNQYTVVYDRANSRVGFARAAFCDPGSAPPVTGHDWYVSSWGSCEQTNGVCTHTRTVTCKDSNAQTAADTACTASTKPAASEQCTTYADGPCQYDPEHPVTKFVQTDTFKWIMGGVAAALLLCCICSCCCKKEHDKRRAARAHNGHFSQMEGGHHHQTVVVREPAAPHYNQYQQQAHRNAAVGGNAGYNATYAAAPAHSQPPRRLS